MDEQQIVDLVASEVIRRRPPTVIEVDHVPEGFVPGAFVMVLGGDEVARIRDVDREAGEIALDRFPRG
jgi:hypothetical protein